MQAQATPQHAPEADGSWKSQIPESQAARPVTCMPDTIEPETPLTPTLLEEEQDVLMVEVTKDLEKLVISLDLDPDTQHDSQGTDLPATQPAELTGEAQVAPQSTQDTAARPSASDQPALAVASEPAAPQASALQAASDPTDTAGDAQPKDQEAATTQAAPDAATVQAEPVTTATVQASVPENPKPAASPEPKQVAAPERASGSQGGQDATGNMPQTPQRPAQDAVKFGPING